MINIRIIFFLLAGTVFFFLLLRFQGRLDDPQSPLQIVSLELANTEQRVADIVTAWTNAGLIGRARSNILIDFLFIPFYSLLFYTLCGSISVRMQGFAAKMGVMLAFCSLVAGLFDVFENILMLFSLHGHFSNLSAWCTSFFATSKFLLLLVCLLYVVPLGFRILLLKLMNRTT
jgi:hypothetical protein